MNLLPAARRALLLAALTLLAPAHPAWTQAAGTAQALQDYEQTLQQADALVAGGDPFEAVRLYERAGRIAYNNKLATDHDALNAKLAAARAARDRAAAAPPKPASPAPPPPVAAAPTPAAPVASTTAGGEADDAGAWIRYGDALVAVQEYKDAVRAYERARRLATAHRTPLEGGALEAKIGAAARARDLPRTGGELIPEPLPPLPDEPGAEPGARFLADHAGRILPWTVGALYSQAELRVSDAELKAFDANLHRIMDVLARAPVLNPPVGFELSTDATLASFEDVRERQRYLAERRPLRGRIRFSASAYVEMHVRSKATGATKTAVGVAEEPFCRYEITVNIPPTFWTQAGRRLTSGDDSYFLEPQRRGDLGGMPVYGDTLVIARPDVPPWLPVSTEAALQTLLVDYKKAADAGSGRIEHEQRAYAEFMSPAAVEKRRREVESERAAGHEANAHKLEIMQHRWEEDARKAAETAAGNPRQRAPVESYRRALALQASLDDRSRKAQACIAAETTTLAPEEWILVPTGTPGCRPLVKANPDLAGSKSPRSDLQVLFVDRVTVVNDWLDQKRFLRNQPGDCTAMARILRQTNWSQLASLLAR